jgi:2-polyprenyl-3-methyl-5-hydroxy-6-metoxy-1,4-benzoquinol methylase
MTDDQFVTNIYSSLLQRFPKEEEVKHWTSLLAGGTSRSEVVETFMSSAEFASLQTQKERFRVSFPSPMDAPRREQDVIAALQDHVVRRRSLNYEEPVRVRREPVNRQPAHPEPVQLQEETHEVDLSSAIAAVSARVRNAKQGVGQLNPRNPGLVSNFVQAAKRVLQRSLTWYTRPLQNYHDQVAEALDEHGKLIVAMDQFLRRYDNKLREHLNMEIVRLHGEISRLDEEALRLDDETLRLDEETGRLRSEILRLDRELSRVEADYIDRLIREAEVATQQHFIPYLEFFREVSPVVDIGCGRGEFLSLLKEAGIASYGVDLDEDAIEVASRKALRVVHEDLFEHLGQLPERSLGGIFSSRVIEFLPEHLQMEFVARCSGKIKPGGVLLIETANPDSRRGYGRVFSLDASHFRPVPAELMKSVLESNCFRDVRIMFPAIVQVASATTDSSVNTDASHVEAMSGSSDRLIASPTYAVEGRRV